LTLIGASVAFRRSHWVKIVHSSMRFDALTPAFGTPPKLAS
jgi:hypothetical protein